METRNSESGYALPKELCKKLNGGLYIVLQSEEDAKLMFSELYAINVIDLATFIEGISLSVGGPFPVIIPLISLHDALEALERKKMLSKRGEYNEHLELALWMAKFCRHIDNDGKQLTDSENFEFFKEKLHAQFGWTFEGDE